MIYFLIFLIVCFAIVTAFYYRVCIAGEADQYETAEYRDYILTRDDIDPFIWAGSEEAQEQLLAELNAKRKETAP